jgi:hypothetical protein
MDIDIKKAPKKAADRRKFLRDHLFPGTVESELWLRKKKIGFTTIPRTMSLIGRILDHVSEKGFPLSDTYLTLWCWVFDEAFLEIRNPKEFAFESGFGGPRAEITWKNRMQRLQDLGFIRAREGLSGPFHNVLILDPIKVIEKLYQERPHDVHYSVFISRLTQIGANDAAVEASQADDKSAD